jgi:Secretion system C-terminal sorting domain
MKPLKTILTSAMLCATVPSWCQLMTPNYPWASRFGLEGRAIATTRDICGTDRVYVAGNFTGTATIGGTTLTSAGGRDIYIARMALDGTVLNAVKFGTAGDETVNDIAVTPSYCSTSLTTAGVYLCGQSDGRPLVLRYSMNLGGPTQASFFDAVSEVTGVARSIALIGTTVYITGNGIGYLTYNNGGGAIEEEITGGSCGANSLKMFVARLSSSLAFTYVLDPPNNYGCLEPNDIAVYNGRAYICGRYSGTPRFTTSALSALPAAQGAPGDVFVCSMASPTASGTVPVFDVNDQKSGGSASSSGGVNPFIESANSLAVSASGVFIGGNCFSGATFGSGVTLTYAGPFLVHYPITAAGIQVADWGYGMTGPGGGNTVQDQASTVYGIALSNAYVWVTGAARNGGVLQGSGVTSKTFPGTTGLGGNNTTAGLLACYDLTGALQWADMVQQNWVGNTQANYGRAITAVGACDLFYTGRVSSTAVRFGNTLSTPSGNSGFVARTTSRFVMQPNTNITLSLGTTIAVTRSALGLGASTYAWSVTPVPCVLGPVNASTVDATLCLPTPGTYTYTFTCTTTGSCPTSGTSTYTVVVPPGQSGQRAPEGVELPPFPLYPNPTTGLVQLTGLGEGAQVTVVDALGRTVVKTMNATSNTVDLDLSAQPKGLYLVQVRAGEALNTQRLVVE